MSVEELLEKARAWLEVGGCDFETCGHNNKDCPLWCVRQALALLREECEWKKAPNNYWKAECENYKRDHNWMPRMKSCPFCGKRIKEQPNE